MFYRKHGRVTFPRPGQPVGDLVTKQSHKAECDIHNILRQYQRTGIINHVQAARPTYQDLPSDVDFQQALHTMMAAEEAFAGLPARVRAHFSNDPAAFLAAFSDPDQVETLRGFGLVNPKPADPPSPSLPDTNPAGK